MLPYKVFLTPRLTKTQIFVAILATLVGHGLQSLLRCCSPSSTLLNMIMNISIALFWTATLVLLSRNLYGMLSHSCSKTNWGNADGVKVCNLYKLAYVFLIFAWLAQIATAGLDIYARRNYMSGATYDNLSDAQHDGRDVKLDTLSRGNSYTNSLNDNNTSTNVVPLHRQNTSYSAEQSLAHEHFRNAYRDTDNALPPTPYSNSLSYAAHLPGAARQASFRSNSNTSTSHSPSRAAPAAARVREDSFDISSGYRDNAYGGYHDRQQQNYAYPAQSQQRQMSNDHFGYNQPSVNVSHHEYQKGYDSQGGYNTDYLDHQQGYDRRY